MKWIKNEFIEDVLQLEINSEIAMFFSNGTLTVHEKDNCIAMDLNCVKLVHEALEKLLQELEGEEGVGNDREGAAQST